MSYFVRNFSIIAHVDHGKSTLADRLLERTGTIPAREMREQVLDQMDLERERGITIKLAPVRMRYALGDQTYTLHLIDTPGHADFSYEVSRSLACVESAVLLVDATQGIQAQTLAHLEVVRQLNLPVVPVVNKIDLPQADVPGTRAALVQLLGCEENDVLNVSGKTGEGVDELLRRIVERTPAPKGKSDARLRGLIFDSVFDEYRGVVTYVRIVDGSVRRGDSISFFASRAHSNVLEVGSFSPKFVPSDELRSGDIGYVVTGLKTIADAKVGDTMTSTASLAAEALPGYRPQRPMVFAGIYPDQGDDFPKLRQAIEKLQLNDASLTFEPERSDALGFGFRCGFLGLLHLDIVVERLRREYGIRPLVTVPSVSYQVVLNEAGERSYRRLHKLGDNRILTVRSALELPDPSQVERVEEPWANVDVVTPPPAIGAILELIRLKRGVYRTTDYVGTERAIIRAEVPLAGLLVDFYDTLKGASAGYASMSYHFSGFRPSEVVRLDIRIAEDVVEALASLVPTSEVDRIARRSVERLKELLPKQMFEVKIQAAVGGKVIASERLPAARKDVTAKLYGGDVTRKRKLLEKQKKGKARLKAFGRIDIPPDVFSAMLRRS